VSGPRVSPGSSPLDWAIEAATWPGADTSRFVEAGGLVWRVQTFGQGPVALLLHGTGASAHSWRHLAPLLAGRFSLVVPDLPGHAFTTSPGPAGMTLPRMAAAVSALAATLNIRPDIIIGHSAGSAIGLQCALDGGLTPTTHIGLNAALLPFGGFAAALFSPLARFLAGTDFTIGLMARRAADRMRVEEVLRGTGSKLRPDDVALYHRLFQARGHVAGALQMMAGWDLTKLVPALPALRSRIILVTSNEDRAVPPEQAFQVRDCVPGLEVRYLRGLGHLAHEEDAAAVVAAMGL
jgi:magnesium chelatase accessory protein